MNRLAHMNSSLTGLLYPVLPGLACGSDTAHLSILGYPPQKFYRSRGAFETIGAGLPMQTGDVAFKASFGFGVVQEGPRTVVNSREGIFVVKSRRCDPDFHEWGVSLCEDLSNLVIPEFPEVTMSLKYATEHRCGLRLHSPFGFSDVIDSMDPLKDDLPLLLARPRSSTEKQAVFVLQTEKSLVKTDDNESNTLGLVSSNAKRYSLFTREELKEKDLGSRNIDLDEYVRRLATYTADVTNAAAHTCHIALENHPITLHRKALGLSYSNIVLFRGCGESAVYPSFASQLLKRCHLQKTNDTHSNGTGRLENFRCGAIAPTAIISGLTQSLGFKAIQVPSECNGMTDSNISKKFEIAFDTMFCSTDRLNAMDFMFLHVKGADEASHNGDFNKKKEIIEKVDHGLSLFLENVSKLQTNQVDPIDPMIIIITGDHSTPCFTRDHGPESVPFLGAIVTAQVLEEKTCGMSSATNFSEALCSLGELGHFNGSNVLDIIHILQEQAFTLREQER